MRTLILLAAVCFSVPAAAQQFGVIETTPLAPIDPEDPLGGDQVLGGARVGTDGVQVEGNIRVVEPPEPPTTLVRVERGEQALLRGLDKISGAVIDIELAAGGRERLGRLEVVMQECRYPADNPSGDAYAFLEIGVPGSDDRMFRGWMFASSPALSAMDHPRYDVWVIRCSNS